MSIFIKIYWFVGFLLIVGYLTIHYVFVLPFLSKRGEAGFFSWLTNLRQDEDLEKYREHCVAEGKSLTIYNILSRAKRLALPFLFGWVILLVTTALLQKCSP